MGRDMSAVASILSESLFREGFSWEFKSRTHLPTLPPQWVPGTETGLSRWQVPVETPQRK